MGKLTTLILLIFLIISQKSSAQVVINELMAANSSTINDPDFDESADWVELYNNSSEELDLSAYFLTDDLELPHKWSIPTGTTIAAYGYLIIWADSENTGLHTSFNLSSDGEEIGLFDNGLNLIDTLRYSLQKTNISYGRHLDGEPDWYWFQKPTPGSSNNTSNPFLGITYFEPIFSTKGGFYQTELVIELTCLKGEIHYTLDGSAPTKADPIYSDGIQIHQNSFIRARVFQEEYIAGPVVTHSYFFEDSFQERELPVVSLVTHPDYFWSTDSGIYVQDFKPEWEYPLNIELFENDGNNRAVFNEKAGVKVNGRLSWQLPQKMLGIYFRKEYGENSLDYPVFNDRERASYNEIVLRAGGSDWSKTLFRDGLGQEIPQDYTPLPHQGFRPCMVFINGEYLGIHNIRSRIDDGFIESNYQMESGTYDLIENHGNVDEGSDVQYELMDDLFKADLSIESHFQALAEQVDMENFTHYWISEIWAANISWGHNINLWKPHEGGKWQFIFADLDRVFIDPEFSIHEFTDPMGDDYYNYGRYWMQSIFQNQAYADFFVQRFNDLIYTSFHPHRIHPMVDDFAQTIDQELPNHVVKWSGSSSNYGDGIESVEAWEAEVVALKDFAEDRHRFIMRDLQSFFEQGTILDLSTDSNPVEAGEIQLNTFPIPAQPWIGPYFEGIPFQLEAIAQPGYAFEGWSAILSEDLISLEEDWKFHDLGADLGSSWFELDYDDSSWSEGPAELGFGDGDENTIVSYGNDEEDKHITTYFRKTFECFGPPESIKASIQLKRDDGAIVYLNGQEIIRNNMPAEGVDFDTRALSKISGAAEDELNLYILEDISLEEINVMAVEIHQISPTSPDLSFDLSFRVRYISEEIISTEETLDITLSSDSGFMARYQSTGACLLPAEIASNTTLSIGCSPYMATGDVIILPNTTLTVDPGVEIWFPEDASLRIEGALLVNGTESQKVVFKANEEYGNESWDFLVFDHASQPSHLNHLEIQEASQGLHPVHHKAAISILYSEVHMDHLKIDAVFGNPIYTLYSDISLRNSYLHSNITGDLINVKYGNCVIDSCTFIGNDQEDTDAIDLDGVVDGTVKNSQIRYFFGSNSDGIDLGEESKNILIENCFINEITDKGISIGQFSTASIQHNVITYCNQGLGIKDQGEGLINHSTFYGNVYAVAAFEKNAGSGGGQVEIYNSILSNSSKKPLLVDALSTGLSEQNIYDTDTLLGESNAWMNPQFSHPNHYDFQLSPGSGAINAGLDGENLGATETQFLLEPKVQISDLLYFHPWNPAKEFIRIHNPSDQPIDISAYELSAGIAFVFPEGTQIQADEYILIAQDQSLFSHLEGQVFEWESGRLNNGGEKIKLSDNHGIVIDHVRYLPVFPWPELQEPGDYISLRADSLDNHFASNWTIGEPLGISENIERQSSLELFPNPCSEVLNIRSSESIHLLQILDMAGRILSTSRHASSSIQMNIEGLEPGVYMLVIDGSLVKRFVKQ